MTASCDLKYYGYIVPVATAIPKPKIQLCPKLIWRLIEIEVKRKIGILVVKKDFMTVSGNVGN